MKTQEFFGKFNELEFDVAAHFDELVHGRGVNFIEINGLKVDPEDDAAIAKEIWETDVAYDFPAVEYRSDTTGRVIDARVLLVYPEGGLKIMYDDEPDKIRDIKFSDLADIRDRLSLLEEIETVVEK